MKTVHVGLTVYARAKAANDEENAILSSEDKHEDTPDPANLTPTGWDPFEVWRTRIKAAKSGPTDN